MTRPQQRAPKGRNRDRADRRAVVDVLLARLQRGVLSPAEGALLAEHVREEQRFADENRLAMAGTTRALAKHREAADAAIVEAEQQLAEVHAATLVRAERSAVAEHKLSESETLGHRLLQRAEQAEQQLAAVRSQLHDVKARRDDARAGRQDAERALDRVRQAQTIGDALAVVAVHDGVSPVAARLQGRIFDRADTVEARLTEQQREHDIALTVERRRTRAAVEESSAQRHQAGRYRTAWFAARRDRKADRAAMAAELPDVVAGQQARAALTGLTVDEAADRMRQWAAAGAPATQFVTTPEQTR